MEAANVGNIGNVQKSFEGERPTDTFFLGTAFNILSAQSYGQNDILKEILFIETNSIHLVYIRIDRSSIAKRSGLYSSHGAKILASTDADDYRYHMKMPFVSMYLSFQIRHTAHLNSKGLYNVITTIHGSCKIKPRKTIRQICN